MYYYRWCVVATFSSVELIIHAIPARDHPCNEVGTPRILSKPRPYVGEPGRRGVAEGGYSIARKQVFNNVRSINNLMFFLITLISSYFEDSHKI